MCSGGGDGGDSATTTENNATIGKYTASGVRGGRGDRGGRAEAAGLGGTGVDDTGNRGEIAEGSTFNYATSAMGRFTGDTRSDQDIANDVAVTEGLERGLQTVRGARGQTINVSSYSRNLSSPTPGSLFDRMNSAPTVGSILGSGISAVVGGPVGFVVGKLGGAVIDQTLGSRSQIPFDK